MNTGKHTYTFIITEMKREIYEENRRKIKTYKLHNNKK